MDATEASFDWQHPTVQEQLPTRLMTRVGPWRQAAGRKDYTEDRDAIVDALAFVGEKLDAYQMARFLEDSRQWPSDADLVDTLRAARTERKQIILELQSQHAVKHAGRQYPVGFRFRDAWSSWEIIQRNDDFCRLKNLSSGEEVGGISIKTVDAIVSDVDQSGVTQR